MDDEEKQYLKNLGLLNRDDFKIVRDTVGNIIGVMNNSELMPQGMRGKLLQSRLVSQIGDFKRYEMFIVEQFKESIMDYKLRIKNKISDMVADFLYYDRKEDEDLPVGKIEELINNDEITMHYICMTFNKELFKAIHGRYPLNDNN